MGIQRRTFFIFTSLSIKKMRNFLVFLFAISGLLGLGLGSTKYCTTPISLYVNGKVLSKEWEEKEVNNTKCMDECQKQPECAGLRMSNIDGTDYCTLFRLINTVKPPYSFSLQQEVGVTDVSSLCDNSYFCVVLDDQVVANTFNFAEAQQISDFSRPQPHTRAISLMSKDGKFWNDGLMWGRSKGCDSMKLEDYNIEQEERIMYSHRRQCQQIYKFCAVGDDWEKAFMTYTLLAAQRSLQSAKGSYAIIPMSFDGSIVSLRTLNMNKNWRKTLDSMKFDNKDLHWPISFAEKCKKAFNTV